MAEPLSPRDPYTPDPDAPKRKRNTAWWLLLLALLIGLVVWDMNRTPSGSAPSNASVPIMDSSKITATGATTDTVRQRPATHECIAGPDVEQVLSGLRQRSFRIDTTAGGEYVCVRNSFGADYTVDVRTSGPGCVRGIRASVKAGGVLKNAQATQDFFRFFTELGLKNVQPDSLYAWMDDHTLDAEVKATFGECLFTLEAPDRNTRILHVEPSSPPLARR